MKQWTQALLGLALAATVVACSGDKRANDANSTTPRDTGAAVGTTGANAERDFIEDQLEDGQAEIALAKLATERATNPQVKEFAQMMVTDHQTAGEELQRIATAANINRPAELDRDHKNVQEDLTKLSGREFDKKYMDAMVDEHQEAVNELERKTDSSNAEVRTWVNKVLPKVREHLEKAKQLKETLDRANS
jgi:putative membrane protein